LLQDNYRIQNCISVGSSNMQYIIILTKIIVYTLLLLVFNFYLKKKCHNIVLTKCNNQLSVDVRFSF
jgi:hypothetical protein